MSLSLVAAEAPPQTKRATHAVARPAAKPGQEPFTIKLSLKHGHIGQVFIGCDANGTDRFDQKLDDMAPPPGIGTVGYTFLVSPDRLHNLYKDIRGFGDPVQWLLYAKPGVKPVTVSWNAKAIPEGWDLFCGRWDGKSTNVDEVLDCRVTTSIDAQQLSYFRFWIKKAKPAKSTAKKDKP